MNHFIYCQYSNIGEIKAKGAIKIDIIIKNRFKEIILSQ